MLLDRLRFLRFGECQCKGLIDTSIVTSSASFGIHVSSRRAITWEESLKCRMGCGGQEV